MDSATDAAFPITRTCGQYSVSSFCNDSLFFSRSSTINAVVIGFGVNIGSFNPSYNVETDLVRFNSTTYDFELFSTPTSKDECKNGGWSTFNPPTGPYKNQGQCVASTNQ